MSSRVLDIEVDSDASIFYEVRQLGTLITPGTLAITVTKPDGAIVSASSPTATLSTGSYRYDFTCDQVGDYIVRIKTTGPRRSISVVVRSQPVEFNVP